MKVIITITFVCNNLWKSEFMALENLDFFLLPSGHHFMAFSWTPLSYASEAATALSAVVVPWQNWTLYCLSAFFGFSFLFIFLFCGYVLLHLAGQCPHPEWPQTWESWAVPK